MWLEIAKPIALMLCMVSLYAVFHTAFLIPASDVFQRIWDSLPLLALSAGISLIGGAIFYETTPEPSAEKRRFSATLPIRVFCWTTAAMLVFFIASWYLENYYTFYRDVRFFP